MIDYIAHHRDQFGVEPICRVLTEHGCPIAPSTFYDTISRRPSRRVLRDEQIMQLIETERASNRFVAGLGAARRGCGCGARATTWLAAPSNG